MTSKVSRAALIASLAVGACGLVAVPADAAITASSNAISTANYYVNNPAVTGAASITPQSAVVTGAVDTGGNPETLLPIPSGGLVWDGSITLTAGVKWADNTTGNYVPVDGIPVSGSYSNVSISVEDASVNNSGAVLSDVSNGGADNYSDVTFEYDPVSDYDANGDQPGPDTQFAQDVEVPTTTGISSVSTTVGAFGLSAQNNTGNTPLTPGTKYYYWIVQQAGGTDAATNVDISQWADVSSNPSDKCYPNVAIAADPTLAAYTTSTQISVDGTTAPALQGPCIYYYGNTGGALYYTSPNGEFTTPALGKLTIPATADVKVTGKGKQAKPTSATLSVTDSSAFKASGSIELEGSSGAKLATAKFSLQPHEKASVKLDLTSKGKTALVKKQAAKIVLTSNWDQPGSRKSVKL